MFTSLLWSFAHLLGHLSSGLHPRLSHAAAPQPIAIGFVTLRFLRFAAEQRRLVACGANHRAPGQSRIQNPEWGDVNVRWRSNARLTTHTSMCQSLRRSSGASHIRCANVPRVCTRGYLTRLLRSQSQITVECYFHRKTTCDPQFHPVSSRAITLTKITWESTSHDDVHVPQISSYLRNAISTPVAVKTNACRTRRLHRRNHPGRRWEPGFDWWHRTSRAFSLRHSAPVRGFKHVACN